MNDLPSTHLLGGGTAMCAGCGGLQAIQEIYDVLGEKTVFVNAAGCMTLLSIYPFTPFRGRRPGSSRRARHPDREGSDPAGGEPRRGGADRRRRRLRHGPVGHLRGH
jgi:hypothetical protein